MKKQVSAWPFLLLSLVIVIIDQVVKHWVRGNIALYDEIEFIPGVLSLTYFQNTGAAFSSFATMTGLLTAVSLVVSIALIVIIWRRVMPDFLGMLALSLVLGGAVGNCIDRALLGYVVDMFHTEFMNFAVFNVADIGVSIGGVLLCIYVLFFWKEEKASRSEEAANTSEEGESL